jgi:tetratricopeptide (TPR) repeat protein
VFCDERPFERLEGFKGGITMIKSVFRERMLAIIAGTILLTFFAVPAALCQVKDTDTPGTHNQRAVEFFKKGFYDHAPKNEAAKAELNYRLAIKEFKAAIAKDASYTEAHRNLARVYYVQRDFDAAAEEYKKVTELAPGDLDAYVNLALAYIELKEFEEAVETLEKARDRTSDPKALDRLNALITKIRTRQVRGVR